MSPGLEMIRAFRVSCGTRLAPRNSKASTTCPLGFTAGAASCLGVSNCGPGWAGGGAACCSAGMVSKGLGFGGVAGGVCVCGCAAGCCANAWTDNPGQMEMTQTQAGITTRRRRLKSFMQAYLSTLRGYKDVETQATVSQVQLRFQRW